MYLISEDASTIEEKLNKMRTSAVLEIYEFSDFFGLGYLISNEYKLYRYKWQLLFNNTSHGFMMKNILEEHKKPINKDKLFKYLNEENNINNDFYNDHYMIIIRNQNIEKEIYNERYYKKLKEAIEGFIKEDL